MTFLDRHPQIEALMDNDDDNDDDPRAAARTALQTIEELERIMNQPDIPDNSIEWKMKWKAMKKTLATIGIRKTAGTVSGGAKVGRVGGGLLSNGD